MKDDMRYEHMESRKEAFASGLLELMMQMPYEKITVRDLCEHLQVSRKTFYRYFSNKEEALHTLVNVTLLKIGAYAPPVQTDMENPFTEEMIHFFYYWSDNRKILQMLLENSLIEMFFFQLVSVALSEMDIFRRNMGNLKQNVQESIAAFYVGGLLSVLLYWLRNDFAESPEEMSELMVRLADRGAGDRTL